MIEAQRWLSPVVLETPVIVSYLLSESSDIASLQKELVYVNTKVKSANKKETFLYNIEWNLDNGKGISREDPE